MGKNTFKTATNILQQIKRETMEDENYHLGHNNDIGSNSPRAIRTRIQIYLFLKREFKIFYHQWESNSSTSYSRNGGLNLSALVL